MTGAIVPCGEIPTTVTEDELARLMRVHARYPISTALIALAGGWPGLATLVSRGAAEHGEVCVEVAEALFPGCGEYPGAVRLELSSADLAELVPSGTPSHESHEEMARGAFALSTAVSMQDCDQHTAHAFLTVDHYVFRTVHWRHASTLVWCDVRPPRLVLTCRCGRSTASPRGALLWREAHHTQLVPLGARRLALLRRGVVDESTNDSDRAWLAWLGRRGVIHSQETRA